MAVTRLAVMMCALVAGACSSKPEFDLIIRGGTVYDGTGEIVGVARADVGIKGDRIREIGDLSSRTSGDTIDATGKTVAPGFVDAQSRSGLALLADGFGESHLRQGITSELLGADSPAFWTAGTADRVALERLGLTLDWNGMSGYFARLESRGTTINVGTLAPIVVADSALRDGAFGVVDDGSASLDGVAALVARTGTTLVMKAGSPATTSDEQFFAVASAARRVVITGIEDPASDVMRRIISAAGRNIAASATVVPTATTRPEALAYGGVFVATDSAAVPGVFAAFPWLLGHIVRDAHAMELREAIRRSTSVPASVFGIAQRGIIRTNYFADVVVFDDKTIGDRATGMEWVVVNGVVELTPKGLTGSRAGTRLLRQVVPR